MEYISINHPFTPMDKETGHSDIVWLPGSLAPWLPGSLGPWVPGLTKSCAKDTEAFTQLETS